MIKTSNGNCIYITIPAKYECIYSNLAIKLSQLGIDIIKDCSCSCDKSNKLIIDSWNMFQAAIIAYEENRENDADIIMINIVSKLKLKCDVSCFNDKYIYYGTSDEIPDIDFIIKGNKTKQSNNSFTASFYKKYQYIALSTSKILDTVENFNFRGDFLYDITNNINLYNIHKTIVINNELYLLYICELNYPLGSNVIVNTKDGNWSNEDIIYYGNSIGKPTVPEFDASDIFNPNNNNELIFNSNNITHYFAIPKNREIKYIRSINGTVDWLYNPEINIDLYNKEDINIGGEEYTLMWFISIIPINGDIKLLLI